MSAAGTNGRGCRTPALVAGLAVAALAAQTESAAAQHQGRDLRVAVLPFEGSGVGDLQAVTRAVIAGRRELELVAQQDAQEETSTTTSAGNLRATGLAGQFDADVIVTGRLERRGHGQTLRLVVVNGADRTRLAGVLFSAPSRRALGRRLRRDLWRSIREGVAEARPGAASGRRGGFRSFAEDGGTRGRFEGSSGDPDDDEARPNASRDGGRGIDHEAGHADVDAAREGTSISNDRISNEGATDDDDHGGEEFVDDGAGSSRAQPFELQLGGGVLSRRLAYRDDLFHALRGYALRAAPLGTLSGRWYPGAHLTNGIGAHIGFEGSFEQGLLFDSLDSGGRSHDSDAWGYSLAARLRQPSGAHQLGAALGYREQAFSVEGGDLPSGEGAVPGVTYRQLVAAVDARFVFGPVAIDGRLEAAHVLSAGEMGDTNWFPRATGNRVSAMLELAYAFGGALAVTAGVELRRYFFDLDPEPGDPFVAGGAIDQYLIGRAALRATL